MVEKNPILNDKSFFQNYLLVHQRIIKSVNSELGFIKSLTFSRKFICILFLIGFLIENKIIRNNDQTIFSFKQFILSLKKSNTFLSELRTLVEKINGNTFDKILTLSSASFYLPSFNLQLLSKEELVYFTKLNLPEESWKFLFDFISNNISSFENYIGILYENDQALINTNISSELNIQNSKILVNLTTRKEQGIFYTPEAITKYLSQSTILSYLSDKIQINQENTLDGFLTQCDKDKLLELLKMINQLKLLDPACGTGNFLLAAAQFLFDLKSAILFRLNSSFNPIQLKFDILISNLFGVDLQHEAIAIMKIRLLFWLLRGFNYPIILNQFEFLTSIFDLDFQNGHSLIGWLSEELPTKEDDFLIKTDIHKILQKTINHLETLANNSFDFQVLEKLRQTHFILSQLKSTQKLYTLFSILSITFFNLQEIIRSLKISTKFFEKLWNFYYQLRVILNQIISEKLLESFLLNNLQIKEKQIELSYLHPFHWNSDFNSILNDGGFDIIIGNPPYIENKKLRNKFEKNLYQHTYSSAIKLYDLSILFLERALKLLKEGGYFSFIITNKFLSSDYGESIRKLLFNQSKIKEIIDISHIPSFKGAAIYPIIISCKKASGTLEINNLQHEFSIVPKLTAIAQLSNGKLERIFYKQKDFYDLPKHILFLSRNFSLIKKINEKPNYQKLGKIVKFHYRPFGFTNWINALENVSNVRYSLDDLKFIGVKNIGEFSIDFAKKIHLAKKEFSQNYFHFREEFTSIWQFLKQPKLLVKEISKNLTVAYDPGAFVNITGIYMIEAPIDLLKVLILILNSKLMDIYYSSLFSSTHLAGGFLRYNGSYLKELPIILPKDIERNYLLKNLTEWLIFLHQLKFINIELPFIDMRFLKILVEYLLNLSNLVIFELYFHDEMNSKLMTNVNNFVHEIQFDKWISMLFESGNIADKLFLNATRENFTIIKKAYEQMIENDLLIKEIILAQSYVKFILSSQ